MSILIDITGQRFGTLVVRERAAGIPSECSARWSVICDCGFERSLRGDLLRAGVTRCLKCSERPRPGPRSRCADISLAQIIASNSEFVTECGCQIWTAGIDGAGYGALRFDGRMQGAHRVSWISNHGPIPDGLFVLHRCDTPPCVNPDHLFLGTHADNVADYWAKQKRLEFLKRHYA